MPDVFQVLKKDHDEVKAMLSELEGGPKASTGATPEQLADEGFISLNEHPAAEFIARCRQLRHWQREFAVAG